MKILVTGGAGYLGAVLVPLLLTEGHEVTVLDNFMYGQTTLLACCFDRNLSVVRADVRDTKPLEDLLPRVDAVVPLACITGAPACAQAPDVSRAVNVDAVLVIAQRLSRNQLLVFPSTNSGYGQSDRPCDEDTPLRPVSLYGRFKVEAETRLLEIGNCVSLRFATLFGISPRMRLDLLVNDFTYRALVDRFVVLFEPHFKRSYLHVRDAARAVIYALENYARMKGRAFNVGLSDANLSKLELCAEIKKQIPNFYFVESAIGEDPDKRDYIVSNAKIEKTGFNPDFSLKMGITELIKGYQILRNNKYSNI